MIKPGEQKYIVLDTSTIVTALLSPRINYETELLKLGQEGKLIFVFSKETFNELKQTLQKIYLKTKINPNKIAKFMAWYKYNGKEFSISNQSGVISRDKSDDIYLHLAVESGAKYVITVDKDLLVLKSFQDTQIITAKEFVNQEI